MQDEQERDSEPEVRPLVQSLEQFDYSQQKQLVRQMFQEWQASATHAQSLALLAAFKNQTQQVTSVLCEQLRIVLEPQLSQHL